MALFSSIFKYVKIRRSKSRYGTFWKPGSASWINSSGPRTQLIYTVRYRRGCRQRQHVQCAVGRVLKEGRAINCCISRRKTYNYSWSFNLHKHVTKNYSSSLKPSQFCFSRHFSYCLISSTVTQFSLTGDWWLYTTDLAYLIFGGSAVYQVPGDYIMVVVLMVSYLVFGGYAVLQVQGDLWFNNGCSIDGCLPYIWRICCTPGTRRLMVQ